MRRADLPRPDALSYLLAVHVWSATPDVRFRGPRIGQLMACARFMAARLARQRGVA